MSRKVPNWTSHVSLEELNAFLDGELPSKRAAEVEKAIDEDAALRARLELYRQQTRRLQALYGPVLRAPLGTELREIVRRFARKSQPK